MLGAASSWGAAKDPYPLEPPRYEAIAEGESPLSQTTMALLQHWFRREPHAVGPTEVPFKYWPHQRRAVEIFIYLYEVCGIRRTEELWRLGATEPLVPQRDPWAKLGAQLATGSGKTKVMSLLVTWAHLNAICEQESRLGFGRHALIVAPGLFVRDRLLQDFDPTSGPSVFVTDPVVPPEYERLFCLKVYDPFTCPLVDVSLAGAMESGSLGPRFRGTLEEPEQVLVQAFRLFINAPRTGD